MIDILSFAGNFTIQEEIVRSHYRRKYVLTSTGNSQFVLYFEMDGQWHLNRDVNQNADPNLYFAVASTPNFGEKAEIRILSYDIKE